MHTADIWLAPVGRTNVVIITIKTSHTRNTAAGLASIIQSTRIQVITRVGIRYVDTAVLANRHATIVSADVEVITIKTVFTGNTGSTETPVTNGTDVSVVARNFQEFVNAAKIRMTCILSAWILVPAADQRTFAFAIDTKVTFSTKIAVIAHAFNVFMHASAITAHVGGTEIVVVAVHRVRDAYALVAAVIDGAGIKIIASQIVIWKQFISFQSCLT